MAGLGSGGGYDTVAGFVLDSLGRLPVTADRFERDGLMIEVVDMNGRRIDELAVSRVESGPDNGRWCLISTAVSAGTVSEDSSRMRQGAPMSAYCRAVLASVIAAAMSATAVTGSSAQQSDDTPPLTAMVGQMVLLEFTIGADRYLEDQGGDHRRAIMDMVDLVADFHLGGFVAEEHNDALFLDPAFAEVRDAEAIGGLHPFVAVNEEGGAVQIPAHRWYNHDAEWIGCTSLGPIPGYQGARASATKVWTCPDHSWQADSSYLPFLRNAHLMADRWTISETQTHGEEIGRALANVNVTMNLAPVLGVSNGTADTSFLGDRTFADDPGQVAQWAGAFSRGVRSGSGGRVATVVKHFPGLGSVLANTDDGPARSPPLADLVSRDLLPYQGSITAQYGASAVMMSNVVVPGLTCPENDSLCRTPATLSPPAYRLLRQRYGWDGLIMTDTLRTAAVLRDGRDISAAAVEAIAAGADMVTIKPATETQLSDYREVLGAVRDAVLAWVAEDPPTRRARLGESLARIRDAKAAIQMGAFE